LRNQETKNYKRCPNCTEEKTDVPTISTRNPLVQQPDPTNSTKYPLVQHPDPTNPRQNKTSNSLVTRHAQNAFNNNNNLPWPGAVNNN
jgi:hypothetical protein